jgi:hypothetical protein
LTVKIPFGDFMETVQDRVFYCCKIEPDCNVSYEILALTYWTITRAMKYDPGTQVYSIAKADNFKLTSPESISRAWRKLVEEGRIVLTEAEKSRRSELETKYRAYHGRGRSSV